MDSFPTRRSSDLFFYYGEGQLGDMRFIKANLALRDHAKNGEDVHLFEEVPNKSGYLRYRGQMVCTGYEWVDAPDTKRNTRKAILFELVPLEAFDAFNDQEPENARPPERDSKSGSLAELRHKALADSAECRT